jgi:hypothetical protein
MGTEISTLNQLPSTTDQIATFVRHVKDEILSGEYNPLDVIVQLRAAQKALEVLNFDPEIEDAVSKEYAKHGQKTLKWNGADIVEKETGTRYDYSGCSDAKLVELKQAETLAAEARKDREAFLKTLKEPVTLVDESTGAIETVNPPVKMSKTSICVTLK